MTPPTSSKAPEARRRLAAIDIGTNSIRSIVVEVGEHADFYILDDEKAMVRIGQGLSETGEISPAAWARAREALARMLKIQQSYGVATVEAVATSAVRQAVNGEAFTAAMRQELGLQIDIISGEEEAQLAFLSACHSFEMDNQRLALIDIGGGSAEVILTTGRQIEEIFSLDLGAVVLTEKFLFDDPVSEEAMKRLRKHVRKTLKKRITVPGGAVHGLIGSGGGMTTIAAIVMAQRNEPFNSVQGYEVLRSEVVHLRAMLQRQTLAERRAVPGLSPERADIIIAGVTVVDELMRFFDTNLLRVNARGIRHGLILRSLEKHGLTAPSKEPLSWRSSVLNFGRACHFNETHAQQVAKLSLALFDAIAAPLGLDQHSRRLLEAAALLHDVGYFINYEQHHKHSYHLIRHARLFGFTPREQEIIANAARYHRRALPKKKHENLQGLSPADRQIVTRLGGILRLADGLDRRRTQAVSSLCCRLDEDSLHVLLTGRDDLSVELHGGNTKSDLFETAFARRLDLAAN